jgi:hypothetical protein
MEPGRSVTTIDRDNETIHIETITTIIPKNGATCSKESEVRMNPSDGSNLQTPVAPTMTVETFKVEEQDLSGCHHKVSKILALYQTFDTTKKGEIIREANTLFDKTNHYFNGTKPQYLLSDPEEIRLWEEMPGRCRRFWNKMRESKGKCPYYVACCDEIPDGIVVVPVEDNCHHRYELGLPHITKTRRELLLWGSDRSSGTSLGKEEVRKPTYVEVVAVVAAKHALD